MPNSSDQLLNGCRSTLIDQDSLYAIHAFNRREASLVFEWATQHGCDPGVFDPGCFYAYDPHGFLAVTKEKEIAGTILALACDEDYGIMGLSSVKDSYKNSAVRTMLEQAGRAYLGDRTIELSCLSEDVRTYRTYGFEPVFTSTCYTGIANGAGVHMPLTTPLAEIPFRWIEAYDTSVTGLLRPKFLSLWINQPKSIAIGILKNNMLCGYGVARISRKGYRIGPLCADTDEYALTILSELCAELPRGAHFSLDCCDVNEQAHALMKRMGMRPAGATVHMSTGAGNVPDQRLYGLTSAELGNR